MTAKLRQARPPAPSQVFGRPEMPPLVDPATGQPRRTWAVSLVLGWSRHQSVEFVFDQKLVTWLLCHQHAFEFFGAVPKRLVIARSIPEWASWSGHVRDFVVGLGLA